MSEMVEKNACLVCDRQVGDEERLGFYYGRVRAVVRVATQNPLGKYRDIRPGVLHICQTCAAKQIVRQSRRSGGLLAGLLAGSTMLLLGGFWQPPLWMLALVILPSGLLYLLPLLRRRWDPMNPDDLLTLFEREIKASLGYKPQAIKLWSQERYRALSDDTTYRV